MKKKFSLESSVRSIPDFPKPGILFRDITTLLQSKQAFKKAIDLLVKKYKNKKIDLVVAVEARGFIVGGAVAKGIGAGFVPEVLNRDILDRIIQVDDEDAIKTVKILAAKEGLFVGISGGAAMWAALEIAKRKESEGKTRVVILPDTGERYLSTWLYQEFVG